MKKKNAIDDAKTITITRVDDVGYVAALPLPEKLLVSNAYLGWDVNDGVVETIITFRFANIHARYRVVDISPDGRTLVGKLIQQSKQQLPPLITPDPETQARRS